MKISMLHNSYRYLGGEDVSTEAECELLLARGHQVRLMTLSNLDIDESSRPTANLRLAMETIWNERARRTVAAAVAADKTNIVHVQNFFPRFSPAVHNGARRAGAATIQHLRNYRLMCFNGFVRDGKTCELCLGRAPVAGVRFRCYRGNLAASSVFAAMLVFHRLRRTWHSEVDAFIANTEFSKRKFVASGLPADRIHVKPNFLTNDPGVATPGSGRYAAFVGRLEPKKGVETLLRAWSELPGIPLKVIGDGPLLSVVRQRVAQSPLRDRVEVTGRLNHSDVMRELRGAGLLVMPSEWYETFGRTMMEAFALGVPVVASRMGAMEEVVDPERTGWHFTPGDTNDLARTVEAAWVDVKERVKRGREARAEFEAKYTAETNYVRLMEIYQHALARRHGS